MGLLPLYFEFFKIGLFSVGGGLATLPFLYDLASRSTWLTPENISTFLAIAQSSPGAIGVNISAQTGCLAAGIPGAVIAPLGLISPAIIAILAVARILRIVKESAAVKAVFGGLRPAAAGLIAAAGFGVIALSLYNSDIHVDPVASQLVNSSGPPSMAAGVTAWLKAVRWQETALFVLLFFLVWKFKKHPVLYIAAAGLAGALLGL